MKKQIVQIPAHRLSKGLYVSQLDRPWIETPFLFQGFEIESDEQLAQLRALCSSVFVEINEEEVDDLLGRTQEGPVADPRMESLDELSVDLTARLGLVPAKDPLTLKGELSNAKRFTVKRAKLSLRFSIACVEGVVWTCSSWNARSTPWSKACFAIAMP
jgi:hypothetical protein